MGKEEERPPRMSLEDMHLINSLRVTRVAKDDNAKALYSREERKELSFYLSYHPKPHTLTLEKTLYVFYPRSCEAAGILVFLDRYGQEWTLIGDRELHTLQHLGILLSYYYMKEGGPKGMGMVPSRGAPHVSFPPFKLDVTSLPRVESRQQKSMPTFANSGHMRSHGPTRHIGSFGSKFFTPMGGFPHGKPFVEYPKKTRPSNF